MMLLLIVLGSFVGGVFLYVMLMLTKVAYLRLLIVALAVAINLVGLLRVQVQYDPSFLGHSDFAVGSVGNCERALGPQNCNEKAEYRGFPFRATRTTYSDLTGRRVVDHSFARQGFNFGSNNPSGFIGNILLYGGIVAFVAYLFVRKKAARGPNA